MGDIELYEDLLGKEYEFGASGPDKYDCYGLVREIYSRIGVRIPKVICSSESFSYLGDTIQNYIDNGYWENIEYPEPYCVVKIQLVPPFVSHIGMVLSDCVSFIHILPKRRVVVERLDSIQWKSRLRGFSRWKN